MKGKSGSFLSLAIMLGVGVFFVLHPGDTAVAAARIIGAALVVLGAIGLINQILKKQDKSVIAIIVYAVEAVFGVIVLASPGFVISLYNVIFGLIVAAYGLSDLLSAMRMKKLGLGSWTAALVLAIISVVLGIVIICNPFGTVSLLVRVTGIVLIYKAVSGMFIRLKM